MFPSPRVVILVLFGVSMFASILCVFRLYLQCTKSSQTLETGQMLSVRFRHGFFVLATTQIVILFGTGVGFAVATFTEKAIPGQSIC
jgi:hypothetical protein